MKNLRVLVWSGVVVGAVLAGSAAVGVYAGEMALHPGRRALGPKQEALASEIAARNHAELKEVAITAADGAVLRGWSIRATGGNGDAVILLHGHTDNRAGMLGYADLLLRHGYSVLLPDARAHGMSGGESATYGVKESDDIRRWFEWVRQTEAPRCIDGLGESMGAAELLESLKDEPGFCAVVAESSFASFREVSYDRMGQKVGAGDLVGRTLFLPGVEAGLLYVRGRYGVNLEQDSPEDAVAASKVPVLLIHGREDRNVPVRHAEMIVAHCRGRSPALGLWEPADAGHTGAAKAEPEEFERRVVGWFQQHDHR